MARHAAARHDPLALARWVAQVLLWVVILGVLGAVTAAVLVPRLGGATPYTVLTGSMRPSLPPGTLVVVRPTVPEEIGIGSVITYQLESGRPAVVTHRVVSAGTTTKGEPVFTTQGDANDAPDDAAVIPVQIRGELWYSVPYLGYVGAAISEEQRELATYVLAGGLGLYALLTLASAVRRRPRAPADGASTHLDKEPVRG